MAPPSSSTRTTLSQGASLVACIAVADALLRPDTNATQLCTKASLGTIVVNAHRTASQQHHLAETDPRRVLRELQRSSSETHNLQFADRSWDFDGAMASTLPIELQELEERARRELRSSICVLLTVEDVEGSRHDAAILWLHVEGRDEGAVKPVYLLYVVPGRVKIVKSLSELLKKVYEEIPRLQNSATASYRVWTLLPFSSNQPIGSASAILEGKQLGLSPVSRPEEEMPFALPTVVDSGGIERVKPIQATIQATIFAFSGLATDKFCGGQSTKTQSVKDDAVICPASPQQLVEESIQKSRTIDFKATYSSNEDQATVQRKQPVIRPVLKNEQLDSIFQFTQRPLQRTCESNVKRESIGVSDASAHNLDVSPQGGGVQDATEHRIQLKKRSARDQYRSKLGTRVWWELEYQATKILERADVVEYSSNLLDCNTGKEAHQSEASRPIPQSTRPPPTNCKPRQAYKPIVEGVRQMQSEVIAEDAVQSDDLLVHKATSQEKRADKVEQRSAGDVQDNRTATDFFSNAMARMEEHQASRLHEPIVRHSVAFETPPVVLKSKRMNSDVMSPKKSNSSQTRKDLLESDEYDEILTATTCIEAKRKTLVPSPSPNNQDGEQITAHLPFNSQVPVRARPRVVAYGHDDAQLTESCPSPQGKEVMRIGALSRANPAHREATTTFVTIDISENGPDDLKQRARQDKLADLRQKKLQQLQKARENTLFAKKKTNLGAINLQESLAPPTTQINDPVVTSAGPNRTAKPSNRRLIQNAIEYTLLAGASLEKERETALQAIANCPCDNFIVLLKSAKELKFRAVYAHHVERGQVTRLFTLTSSAPPVLTEDLISVYFRYNSGKKEFCAVDARSFTVKTDGCALLEQLVFAKKKKTQLSRLL